MFKEVCSLPTNISFFAVSRVINVFWLVLQNKNLDPSVAVECLERALENENTETSNYIDEVFYHDMIEFVVEKLNTRTWW
jgi:hypothetical protein